MKTTQISYDELDAYVQHGRNLRARAIREFFRALFTSAKPVAPVKREVHAG